MNNTDSNPSTASTEESHRLQRAVRDLLGIGTAWARYGLGVGSAALATSATTLRTTARALEAISDKLEHPEEQPPREARVIESEETQEQATAEKPDAA